VETPSVLSGNQQLRPYQLTDGKTEAIELVDQQAVVAPKIPDEVRLG